MTLAIDGVRLDDPQNIFVIAEASGNHSQDYTKAESLVIAAADCGANAIKFQTFVAEDICADIPFPFGHDVAHDAWARSLGVERLRDLFKLGGLPRDWHKPLKDLAESLGITFLSTPFSVDAAKFLVEEVGTKALKIASGDLTFEPLIAYVSCLDNIPIIVSTGGAYYDEIWRIVIHNIHLKAHLALLHCCSSYPADETIINLKAIKTLSAFSVPVGFSDHTLSVDIVPALAIANGSTIIEKHIRLEHDHDSVDAAHSLPPSQFSKMVDVIRTVPSILGTGIKEPHASELHDRLYARRDPSDWLRPQMRGRLGDWE